MLSARFHSILIAVNHTHSLAHWRTHSTGTGALDQVLCVFQDHHHHRPCSIVGPSQESGWNRMMAVVVFAMDDDDDEDDVSLPFVYWCTGLGVCGLDEESY